MALGASTRHLRHYVRHRTDPAELGTYVGSQSVQHDV